MAGFEQWLCDRLTALKVDSDVFGSYIQGILEGDERRDEKIEAIEGILSDACSDSSLVSSTTQEILGKFAHYSGDPGAAKLLEEPVVVEGFEQKVKSIFSQQNAKAQEAADKKKSLAGDETNCARLKSSILNQYAEIEVEEDDPTATGVDAIKGNEPSKEAAKGGESGTKPATKKVASVDPLLMTNTNAAQVQEAERLKREKNKQEAEAKKAKDKLDRETQKKKEADRKEKEKQRTQKGERRR